MIKKRTIFLLAIISVLIFTFGCSSETNTESNNTVDANFIKDLGRSVNERGIIVNKADEEQKELGDKFDEKKLFDHLKSYVKTEIDILGKYEDAEFADPKLKKLAMDYIDGLRNQEKSLEYFYGDEDKWDSLWRGGYDKRSVSLFKMVDEYGVKVDEKNLVELKQNAQSVKEEEENQNKINETIKAMEFKQESNMGDWKEYAAVAENPTDIEFKHFYINIKLLDKDGIVIDTALAQATNWDKGEKVKFTFSTDKVFDEIKWDWEGYYD